MDVLSSRVLLHPIDHGRSMHFYRHVLGLAIAREFGPTEAPGTVFFLGNGLLEISAGTDRVSPQGIALWVQVRDVAAERDRLAGQGVPVHREPRLELWGLIECWIADPDGVPIVLVEIPPDHPLRRDQRPTP